MAYTNREIAQHLLGITNKVTALMKRVMDNGKDGTERTPMQLDADEVETLQMILLSIGGRRGKS